ncbi:MAG: hypothetical protein ABGW81_03750 [Paracoccaceae bacterium]
MPKPQADAETAAKMMLKEYWRFDENNTEPGRFHNFSTAWLSEDVLLEIADDVWG